MVDSAQLALRESLLPGPEKLALGFPPTWYVPVSSWTSRCISLFRVLDPYAAGSWGSSKGSCILAPSIPFGTVYSSLE